MTEQELLTGKQFREAIENKTPVRAACEIYCGTVGSLTRVQEQKIEHPRVQEHSNVFFGGIRP